MSSGYIYFEYVAIYGIYFDGLVIGVAISTKRYVPMHPLDAFYKMTTNLK